MAEITFETFGRKLNQAAASVRNSEATIVRSGSQALASEVAVAYRRATGGDGKLSGTGKARRGTGKEAAVSARTKDVRRYSDGTYVGLVVPTGPYGLIERPIPPHQIRAFRFSDRRRRTAGRKAFSAAFKAGGDPGLAFRIAQAGMDARTARALRIPGSPRGYAASAQHPGTRGRDVFTSTVRGAGPKVNDRMIKETVKQMAAGYRGG